MKKQMAIPSDLSTYVQPLISNDFNEVVEIANKLMNAEDPNFKSINLLMLRLSGYLFSASTLAGYYSAERRRLQYHTIVDSVGPGFEREARGKDISADLRSKELIFENMAESIKQMIWALKNAADIMMREKDVSGNQEG